MSLGGIDVPMNGTLRFEAITERDIDLLIIEELLANPSFARWFCQQCGVHDGHVENCWHSVVDKDGESDMVVAFRACPDKIHMLLVENKIDAPPQPMQAKRYRKRGESGMAAGKWSSFSTCIIAPSRYLASSEEARLYDLQISYEDIGSAIGTETPRASYRTSLLTSAIDQQRRTNRTAHSPWMTKFWREYWLAACRDFPELEMEDPGPRQADGTFVVFKPRMLQKGRSLVHKMDKGTVDLEIAGQAANSDDYQKRFRNLLQPDMSIEPASKSMAVKVQVPLMDFSKEFSEQTAEVFTAMKASYRLLYLSAAIPTE